MTAASGILHKEYHAAEYAERGGPFHMAQLWVNLPRAHKMDAPGYQAITAAQIPVVESDGARLRVIAGEHAGVRGAARTMSRVTLLDATLKAGARLAIDTPAGDNLGVLILDGAVRFGERSVRSGELVLFANDGERAELEGMEDAHVLVIGGEPIREPIAAYGPFVMNTAEEIVHALEDLRAGKLGELS
jgi:redox-sensitive bicupin YhaK (pirin superfamily)